MKKLFCPVCGWSDFLKFDYEYHWHCQICSTGYTEDEVLGLEKDIPVDEAEYGESIINIYQLEYDSFGIRKPDAYYQKYIDNSPDCTYETSETNYGDCEDESEWQVLDGQSPFDPEWDELYETIK